MDADSGVAFLLDQVMVGTSAALPALSVGIFNRRGDHQPSGPDASALPAKSCAVRRNSAERTRRGN
jgi:hypothetical protein